MEELHGDIHKVNECFSDIQGLIAAQQESVTAVEDGANAAASRAQDGIKQLEKAQKNQKQGFSCFVIALAICAGVLLLVNGPYPTCHDVLCSHVSLPCTQVAVLLVVGSKYGALAL